MSLMLWNKICITVVCLKQRFLWYIRLSLIGQQCLQTMSPRVLNVALNLWHIRNKWFGVAILLPTGGQRYQAPIHTLYPQSAPIPKKSFKPHILPLFNSCVMDQWIEWRTGRWTDGWTKIASYRVACPQLKKMTLIKLQWRLLKHVYLSFGSG